MDAFDEILQANGFQIMMTGGGCTAWVKQSPDGGWLMLTSDGASHKIDAAACELGVYTPAGDCLLCVSGKLSSNLLAAAVVTN